MQLVGIDFDMCGKFELTLEILQCAQIYNLANIPQIHTKEYLPVSQAKKYEKQRTATQKDCPNISAIKSECPFLEEDTLYREKYYFFISYF